MAIKQKLIPLFKCPLCDIRKKPFKSVRALNTHVSRSHPEYNFKFRLNNQLQAIRTRKKLNTHRI